MRSPLFTIFGLALLLCSHTAEARDTVYYLPIAEVLSDGELNQKLQPDIKFYFGGQPIPGIADQFGEFVTNRKTNSFGKKDETACRWAMLSALLQLQERAHQLGGDAVVNVVSYYKKQTNVSTKEYECHAGAFVAGVALKGTIVRLGNGGARVTQAGPVAGRTNAEARLHELEGLRSKGLISRDEYDSRRRAIIDGL